MSSSLLILIIIGTVCFAAVLLYNRLIALRNRFLNNFSQIEVQLQRRYELVPNLVETARAYMTHETETLVAVTDARNVASQRCAEAAGNPQNAALVGALASADNSLSGALGRFNMVMESYPDLKADGQMLQLQEELTSTENRVAFARQAYSDSVMLYNTAREQFPSVIIANTLSFKAADLFEVSEPAMKQAVRVSFA